MDTTFENKGKNTPWAMIIILVLAAVAAPLSLNKVSPIAPALMDYFKIGETQLGMLISVFSFTGIILALPGGLLIRRFGPWKCVLAALLALLAGSVMGTYSGSFQLLLVSRVVEGIGMTLVAMAGPAIIGASVNPARRGIAMGLFSAYMGIGQVITYNLAPRIVDLNGWRGVWWFSTGYIILFTVIWMILMTRTKTFAAKPGAASVQPGKAEASGADKAGSRIQSGGRSGSVFKNRSLWYLALAMCLYIISYVSIQMFLPSYLSEDRGIDMAKASSMVSVMCLAGTVCSLIAGEVSDRLGSRRILGGLSLIVSGGLFALLPFFPTASYMVLIVILGLVPPILPVCVFAAASEVIDNPSEGGIAMGLISMGQNMGLAAGPVVFGAITQSLGWNSAFFFAIPVSVIGGLAMLANRRVK